MRSAAVDVAALQRPADRRRRDDLAARLDLVGDLDGKAEALARALAETAASPSGPCRNGNPRRRPAREGRAGAPAPRRRTPPPSARRVRRRSVSDTTPVSPSLAISAAFCANGVSRNTIGRPAKKSVGMRLERQRRAGRAARVREIAGARQHGLMAAMHAVEIADGVDARAAAPAAARPDRRRRRRR